MSTAHTAPLSTETSPPESPSAPLPAPTSESSPAPVPHESASIPRDRALAPTTAPPPAPAPSDPAQLPPKGRTRVFAAAAAIIVGGVWGWSAIPISLALFSSGISSLPALGVGAVLLAVWFAWMLAAVHVQRHRVIAVHRMPIIVPRRKKSPKTGIVGGLTNFWYAITTGSFWKGVLHYHVALLNATTFTTGAFLMVSLGWSFMDSAIVDGGLSLFDIYLQPWALGAAFGICVLLALGLIALAVLLDRLLAQALISGSEDDLRNQVVELSEQRKGAVGAAEIERLRIERDLHDGVQPRLVSLGMTLGMAKNLIEKDPQRAYDLVDEAHTEAKTIMTELRNLARGIHPAVLTDRGLDPALSALAARMSIPVDLQVELPLPLDREREAVAYFLVAEALTNITRHSGATRAQVHVSQKDGYLHVFVADDGRGGAAISRDGASTGLAGLSDRVRATGGHLTVNSPLGHGTVLTAVIPMPAANPAPSHVPADRNQEAAR